MKRVVVRGVEAGATLLTVVLKTWVVVVRCRLLVVAAGAVVKALQVLQQKLLIAAFTHAEMSFKIEQLGSESKQL